jgi:hypothetical protein
MRGHRPAQLCRAANRFDYRRLNCGELACFASLPLHPKFPFLAPSRETGSDMTARGVGSLVPSVSTIQSVQTAAIIHLRKKGLFGGTFDVVRLAIPSLRIGSASPQPILAISLCSRKIRSWRLNSEAAIFVSVSSCRMMARSAAFTKLAAEPWRRGLGL